VLEAYAVAAADSRGALLMGNALAGVCVAQTDMVGLLDPPQNWFVKATGGAADNGTNGTSWATAWSVGGIGWSRVLASDIIWFGGGTYSAELSVPKSGAANNPITFKRVVASDPANVTTGVSG
jgi:hypothetical protein